MLPNWLMLNGSHVEEVVKATEALATSAPQIGTLSEEFLQEVFEDIVTQKKAQGELAYDAQRTAWQVVSGFVFERIVDLVAADLEVLDEGTVDAFSEEARVLRSWMSGTNSPAADSTRKHQI